jgi:hypothetical protein
LKTGGREPFVDVRRGFRLASPAEELFDRHESKIALVTAAASGTGRAAALMRR